MDKRGFELIWSTVVVIILALMLLLFSVLFFTNAGKSFLDNIRGYTSNSNVDSVIKGCNILADSGSDYEFCCGKKTVSYYDNGKQEIEASCQDLVNKTFINNKIKKVECENVIC